MESVELLGEIRQRIGRLIASSFFSTAIDAPCDGVARPWSAYAAPSNATFSGGKALAVSIAVACGEQCGSAYVEREIKLSHSAKRSR